MQNRFFLNFDTVFLSELLDAVIKDDNKFKHIKPNTCFSLPQDISQIPFFLKYTASVNVMLAYYKIQDNVIDSSTKINIWKAFRFVESRNFKKAKNFLKESGVLVNLIEDNIQSQFRIEKHHGLPDRIQNRIIAAGQECGYSPAGCFQQRHPEYF